MQRADNRSTSNRLPARVSLAELTPYSWKFTMRRNARRRMGQTCCRLREWVRCLKHCGMFTLSLATKHGQRGFNDLILVLNALSLNFMRIFRAVLIVCL